MRFLAATSMVTGPSAESLPRTVPATGCAAAFSALMPADPASLAAFFAESVGGGGAPNNLRNTVNGF